MLMNVTIQSCCYAEYHYAVCRHAKCRYAVCRFAECSDAKEFTINLLDLVINCGVKTFYSTGPQRSSVQRKLNQNWCLIKIS
jgi:hypothetical protein